MEIVLEFFCLLTRVCTEASRAKHKFAVKRNSWPKTRGVAMNPVDHPHGGVRSARIPARSTRQTDTDTACRVTTNILVRRLRSTGTPRRVRRLVSSPPGGRVCFAVPRRRRIKVGWLFLGHRDGVYRVASFTGTFQGQIVGSSGESTRAFHDSQSRAVQRRCRSEKSVMTAGLLHVLIGPKRMRGLRCYLNAKMNDQTHEVTCDPGLGLAFFSGSGVLVRSWTLECATGGRDGPGQILVPLSV